MISFMERMRAEGVIFSLDDYGSGFATIGTLLTYPVSLVKFDRSILWECIIRMHSTTILKRKISA